MILDRALQLDDFGEIPVVTIRGVVFPRFDWLIKACNENTRDNQKKIFQQEFV